LAPGPARPAIVATSRRALSHGRLPPLPFVMAGLVPAIHAFAYPAEFKIRPAMTASCGSAGRHADTTSHGGGRARARDKFGLVAATVRGKNRAAVREGGGTSGGPFVEQPRGRQFAPSTAYRTLRFHRFRENFAGQCNHARRRSGTAPPPPRRREKRAPKAMRRRALPGQGEGRSKRRARALWNCFRLATSQRVG
jgi:hypothetical protein